MMILSVLVPFCVAATSIENVHIIDPLSGSVERDQIIVMEGGQITAIRSGSAPDQATPIDGGGRYALPPLVDAHAHLFDQRDLETFAAHGVLLVRNLDGWSWHLTINDDAVGKIPRARMVTAGSQLHALDSRALTDRFAAEKNYPWVKVYDEVSRDELRLIGSYAEQSGRRVTGHVPDGMAPFEAIESGVFADIAHVEEILPHGLSQLAGDRRGKRIQALARVLQKANVAVTTTLITNDRAMAQVAHGYAGLDAPETADAAPVLQAFWHSPMNPFASSRSQAVAERMRGEIMVYQQAIAAWHASGVQLLPGTDAPSPGVVPGASLLQELSLWQGSGIPPSDIVRLATVAAAQYLTGVDTTLRPGAAADFLLLDGNPLEDIANLQTLSAVVQKGVVFTRERLALARTQRRETFAMERDTIGLINPASPDRLIAQLAALDNIADRQDLVLSLSWMYLKFGNSDACQALQGLLAERQRPGCP